MIKTITLLCAFVMLSYGQIYSSVEIKPIDRPIYQTSPASFDSGEYSILNSYSNQALGSQAIGKTSFAAQLDTLEPLTWELIPDNGQFRIRASSGGFLEEISGYKMVRLGEKGTLWSVSSIEDGGAYEIRGQAGILEIRDWNSLSGAWASIADSVTGGANQQWLIVRPSTARPVDPKPIMEVRHGDRVMAVRAGHTSARPKISWERQGSDYVYRVQSIAGPLQRLYIDREAKYDAVEVKTPDGWVFGGTGWYTVQNAAPGEFSLKSTWAPGPVVLQAIGEDSLGVVVSPDTQSVQARAAMFANLHRGTHRWAIGPAIPPGTDAAGLRKLARHWNTLGLAFVAPLLDESRDVQLILSELLPQNDFERQVLSLCLTVNGQ